MAQEMKPILEISRMAFNALQTNYRNAVNAAVTAALAADGLSITDGWQVAPDGAHWLRVVPDARPTGN